MHATVNSEVRVEKGGDRSGQISLFVSFRDREAETKWRRKQTIACNR